MFEIILLLIYLLLLYSMLFMVQVNYEPSTQSKNHQNFNRSRWRLETVNLFPGPIPAGADRTTGIPGFPGAPFNVKIIAPQRPNVI